MTASRSTFPVNGGGWCHHLPPLRRWSNLPRMKTVLPLAALLLVAAAEPGKPPITAQTSSSGGPLDPAQKAVRFDFADLAIEVFPEREAIAGTATLYFTTRAATGRLAIDLDRNYAISAVAVDGRPLATSAWSNPQGRVAIKLPRRVAAGQKLAVRIAYAGKPHVAVRPPWDGGFIWAKTPAGQPWIATAVQMEGCDLIWPCIDYPTYEPDRIALHITVPKGLKAISNGVLRDTATLPDGRTTWNWEARDPTLYGVALNIGPYEVVSGSYRSRFGNTIPMFYWYLPGEKDKAEKLFAEFAPTLDFFESVIGPYPFADQKLGVVETPHKGMEHQTVNAYGNNYAKSRWGFDDLFQHEFSHEWFANQLTAANWDDFWLHEGTGSYMQPLYAKWRWGDGAYVAHLLDALPRIYNRTPIVTGRPQSAEDVYDDKLHRGGDIYTKGSWTLHTLRGLIGDEAFFRVLRLAIYGREDPKPGNFRPLYRTTPEFVRLVRQVTGTDYQWFFDVYLYAAALPRLEQRRDGSTLSLSWRAPGDRPFPMPIEVEVDGKVTRLAMTGGRDTLAVPPGAHVVIDPMWRVLRYNADIEAFGDWGEAKYKAEQAAKAKAN